MKNHLWYKEEFPEFLDIFYRQPWEETGVPRPAETLTGEFTHLKNKDVTEKYTIKTNKQKRIFCEDIGLEWAEASRCLYLDIDNNTPESENVDTSKIISIGIGQETRLP